MQDRHARIGTRVRSIGAPNWGAGTIVAIYTSSNWLERRPYLVARVQWDNGARDTARVDDLERIEEAE